MTPIKYAAPRDDASLDDWLAFISQIHPREIELGLERVSRVASRLGLSKPAPKVITVAGTNGKGSTVKTLETVLRASGYSTGAYTSPHILRFSERIRLQGEEVADAAIVNCFARIEAQREPESLSYFEFTTLAALMLFADAKVDFALLEVGLGGRLDATNVLTQPVACGIASLGLDHEGFLLAAEDGVPDMPPLDRIAFEKAGIAKSGSPLLTQKYSASMANTVATHASLHNAPLHARGQSWDATVYDGRLHYRDATGKLNLPLPRMTGAHQANNAALAIAMLRHQTAIHIPEAALAAAMEWTRWPARMQTLSAGPLTDRLPTGSTVWLDGGHNPDAGAAIAKTLEDGPSVHVIIGMLENKDANGFLAPFAHKIETLTAVPIAGHAHHDPKDLRQLAQSLLHIADARPGSNVSAALELRAAQKGPSNVLICGSLYLAGEVLRLNDQVPD